MIVRSWRGRAAGANVNAYVAHAQTRVLPQLATLAGYKGALVLTDEHRQPADIVVLTFWDSIDAIRAFAGDDPSVAVVEPEAQAVLAGFDKTAQHFAVAASDGMTLRP